VCRCRAAMIRACGMWHAHSQPQHPLPVQRNVAGTGEGARCISATNCVPAWVAAVSACTTSEHNGLPRRGLLGGTSGWRPFTGGPGRSGESRWLGPLSRAPTRSSHTWLCSGKRVPCGARGGRVPGCAHWGRSPACTALWHHPDRPPPSGIHAHRLHRSDTAHTPVTGGLCHHCHVNRRSRAPGVSKNRGGFA
jgi:hypothetical protein